MIIAVIVYLAAFSLVIKLWLNGKKRQVKPQPAAAAPLPGAAEQTQPDPTASNNGKEAQD